MPAPKRTLVTAALPYANGPVHIGHLAGCYLPADIYVRYLRKAKRDVRFICGTDEHGVAITLKARKEGLSPRAIVDRYHEQIKKAFEDFGISFDIFSRTTKAIHHQTAQEFFQTLHQNGSLLEKTTEQYYDPEAGQFLADRFIRGECPNCGHPEAYGDQCENCGSSLSPEELLQPRSILSGAKLEKRSTTHWFLPLNHLSDKIEAYLLQHQDWKPNVYGQCMSWLKSGDGLQARSMTRDLDWGIPVPLPEGEGKVLYVWFDAPIGYISASKELLGEAWRDYWQDENSRLVHFIGKDNIVFHCITFPAMLMEHGDYQLPAEVPANEFLNLEGQKISTSRNWAVWLHEYLEDFPAQQDALRYALTANAPETKDNDFTWEDFQARNNNELVAVLGNFTNRVLVLLHKYYEGAVPPEGARREVDAQLAQEIQTAPGAVAEALERFRLREAQQNMMHLARQGNKYLTEQEPWKTAKSDPQRTATVLHWAAQTAAQLSQLMEPFLPFAAQQLQSDLALPSLEWSELSRGMLLSEGHMTQKGQLLFEKIADEQVAEQQEKLRATAGENKAIPFKEESSFEHFQKLDLRVGSIRKAQAVPKSKKLLELEVDLGSETRRIVSGIKAYFSPEELVGRKVTVLANLPPRKIRGIVSEGMLLLAENGDGRLALVEPEAAAENGAPIA